MAYSKLTNFNIIEKEESQNINEEKSSNKNDNTNKILTNLNIYKKYNSNSTDKNNKSFNQKKESNKKLMLNMNEEENIDLNMRKRSYSVRKNIQHSIQKKNFIINEIKEKNNSNIINESNIKVNNSSTCSNTINKKELSPNVQKKARF
jgi:hypothetical protein